METQNETVREQLFKPMSGKTCMKLLTVLFIICNHGFFIMVPLFYLLLFVVFLGAKLIDLIRWCVSKGVK